MNYLAIDTASNIMKVLVCKDGNYGYFQSSEFRAASERLMPELDKLLKASKFKVSDTDFFACVIGPGSFTGIRIGMATVKALAYACGKPTVAVTALELLAYNNKGEETVIAVCDAGNGMRYVAVYDDKMHVIMEPRCLTADELKEFVESVDEPYAVYADSVSAESIDNAVCPTDFRAAFIRAVEANKSNTVDGNALEPVYIRKPQAERDLENKK